MLCRTDLSSLPFPRAMEAVKYSFKDRLSEGRRLFLNPHYLLHTIAPHNQSEIVYQFNHYLIGLTILPFFTGQR